jgi:hypothetical protein
MGEKWFEFVKRIHTEGQKKNSDYSMKDAMQDASKRKSEWKKGPSTGKESTKSTKSIKKTKRSKKGGKARTKKRGGKKSARK